MKGKALEGRDGCLLRKYTNIFPKSQGKDTKNLLCNMIIQCSNWSLVFPNTSRKRQGFSQISRRVIFVRNQKMFGCSRSINTMSSLPPKLLTILITAYARPSYNYIIFLPETFHIMFLQCQENFKLKFSEKPMRFSHICHSCNMFSPYHQI